MGGQLATTDLADRSLAHPGAHETIVIEHRDPVRGEPHIALEAGGPEPASEIERLDRVVRCLGPGTAVSEPDRGSMGNVHLDSVACQRRRMGSNDLVGTGD
ncbi:MAG: hypothetical protein NVS3B12_19860 [Acidimicrobiales bacterium]